jgi:hypothetical protein
MGFATLSAIAPALLNHRDVANAENAGAVFCLPPASLQSYLSYTLPIGFGESSGVGAANGTSPCCNKFLLLKI